MDKQRYGKRRHGSLYQQIVAEFEAKGYDRKTAMEMAGDYLDMHEMYDDYTGDDDFTRTVCHIPHKRKEDDE